jgi:hypothetical protein
MFAIGLHIGAARGEKSPPSQNDTFASRFPGATTVDADKPAVRGATATDPTAEAEPQRGFEAPHSIAATLSCSNATLNGTYAFGYVGWSISGGQIAPFSAAGFDTFNGAGTSTGVITVNSNGVVVNNNTTDTSTYTIESACTGTIVFNIAGTLAHFNVYVSPDGDQFMLIETDQGSVIGGTETRVHLGQRQGALLDKERVVAPAAGGRSMGR